MSRKILKKEKKMQISINFDDNLALLLLEVYESQEVIDDSFED